MSPSSSCATAGGNTHRLRGSQCGAGFQASSASPSPSWWRVPQGCLHRAPGGERTDTRPAPWARGSGSKRWGLNLFPEHETQKDGSEPWACDGRRPESGVRGGGRWLRAGCAAHCVLRGQPALRSAGGAGTAGEDASPRLSASSYSGGHEGAPETGASERSWLGSRLRWEQWLRWGPPCSDPGVQ
jgi:hypothetical protein